MAAKSSLVFFAAVFPAWKPRELRFLLKKHLLFMTVTQKLVQVTM